MAVRMTVKQNAEQFVKQLQVNRNPFGTLDVALGNSAEYATHLQNRESFHVVDERALDREVTTTLRRLFRRKTPISRREVRDLLEAAAVRAGEKQQSFTGNLRPPARRGGPDRPAHPGNWADVTTHLASSYYVHVRGRARRYLPYSGRRYDQPIGGPSGGGSS